MSAPGIRRQRIVNNETLVEDIFEELIRLMKLVAPVPGDGSPVDACQSAMILRATAYCHQCKYPKIRLIDIVGIIGAPGEIDQNRPRPVLTLRAMRLRRAVVNRFAIDDSDRFWAIFTPAGRLRRLKRYVFATLSKYYRVSAFAKSGHSNGCFRCCIDRLKSQPKAAARFDSIYRITPMIK